jgi:hypothetical protein
MFDFVDAKVTEDLVRALGDDSCERCKGAGKAPNREHPLMNDLCDCAKARLGKLVAFVDGCVDHV